MSRRRKKRRKNKPQEAHGHPPQPTTSFWGEQRALPAPQPEVRITDDPAAVPRSLGLPPLPGHDDIAEHYFAAVYERAVTLAGALAAAGGMIQPEDLAEELND